METGIIILAHGSKIESGNEGLYRIVDLIREIGGYKEVEPAFLQLATPSLNDSIQSLLQRKVKKILIMPLLLFSGNHVREDIPQIIEAEKTKHPDITFVLARNIGPDLRIAKIAHDRIEEALHGS